MKMMKRKGVSTYISVLLLIVVTIAGGVMIYGYTIGWFGRLGGEGEMGTLSIDEVNAIGATDLITAYVRNVGSSSVILDAVYVEGIRESDEDEFIEVLIYELDEVVDMIEKGIITDAKTIIAIQAYRLKK